MNLGSNCHHIGLGVTLKYVNVHQQIHLLAFFWSNKMRFYMIKIFNFIKRNWESILISSIMIGAIIFFNSIDGY